VQETLRSGALKPDEPAHGDDVQSGTLRARAVLLLSIGLGLFILYSAAFGAFESLIQRASFVALVATLGVLMHPLLAGSRFRALGIAIDAAMIAIVVYACASVIVRFEQIMVERPFAELPDVILAFATLAVILEIARRAVSWVFPLLVIVMVAYALFGDAIPGRMGHRGFDVYYVSETIFLSDLGLWGMLVGIASTTLAIFVLFGAFLLHTGAGKTFFDLASRASGNTPGGAAKIATIASGFFGMISGSTVANVATTGNFTIPLMRRLNYPRAYAGGVEAVASTGGQLAPPIMGTAAFVMAELVGVSYWTIAAAALLPSLLFYLGIFATVHVIAVRKGLGATPPEETGQVAGQAAGPVFDARALAPIVASLGGIVFGILNGNSVDTSAFYGIAAMIVAFVLARLSAGEGPWQACRQLAPAIVTGGRGVVIVGLLLVAAQVFVSLLNLTGVGVTLTGIILSHAGGNVWAIAIVMAVVCLIAGMGLPTSAAYVLVAAVFAPALIQAGLPALTVHLFVLYYATLSVITPPVCVGVFVAASIAEESWPKVAAQAVRLGAVAYVLPMLFLLYPGLLMQGGFMQIAEAALVGVIFTLSLAFLLGWRPAIGTSSVSSLLWVVPLTIAFWPGHMSTLLACAIFAVLMLASRVRKVPVPV